MFILWRAGSRKNSESERKLPLFPGRLRDLVRYDVVGIITEVVVESHLRYLPAS